MYRALAIPLFAGILAAQSPQFDTAAVKPNSDGHGPLKPAELEFARAVARASRGGRFRLSGVPVNLLMELAYGVRDFQIADSPSWANSELYDISAKTQSNATYEQMQPMVASLLTDRFQLKFHRETRSLPVYELVAAKGGLKIATPRNGSCVTFNPNIPPLPGGANICGSVRSGNGRIEAYGVLMSKLIELLTDRVGRAVIDKTGFTQTFDFDLNFTPENPISHTLEEQLGLSLQPAKGPVEVLVVDRLERPAAN
jgi:uncharacterized protein (TIGR03435 family)